MSQERQSLPTAFLGIPRGNSDGSAGAATVPGSAGATAAPPRPRGSPGHVLECGARPGRGTPARAQPGAAGGRGCAPLPRSVPPSPRKMAAGRRGGGGSPSGRTDAQRPVAGGPRPAWALLAAPGDACPLSLRDPCPARPAGPPCRRWGGGGRGHRGGGSPARFGSEGGGAERAGPGEVVPAGGDGHGCGRSVRGGRSVGGGGGAGPGRAVLWALPPAPEPPVRPGDPTGSPLCGTRAPARCSVAGRARGRRFRSLSRLLLSGAGPPTRGWERQPLPHRGCRPSEPPCSGRRRGAGSWAGAALPASLRLCLPRGVALRAPRPRSTAGPAPE